MGDRKHNEFAPKETSPNINAGIPIEEDKLTRRYDLVEEMQFLFVKVARARDLPTTCDPYVELKLGNFKGTTRHSQRMPQPIWNQVFAFEKDKIQDLYLQVLVKSRGVDAPFDFLGRVQICVPDVPKRVPPEGPLAPEWHKLENLQGTQLINGDIMLAAWMGTQADECFSHAWFSDAASISGDAVTYTRSKVYMSPTFWYLRVNVIQAQDLLPIFAPQDTEIFVQVDLGALRLRTNFSKNKNSNPMWNEDLLLVAQEPFDDTLKLGVRQRTMAGDVSLGSCAFPLNKADKRLDGKPVPSRWFNLEKPGIVEPPDVKFASKLNARISLDGAYHVFDEPVELSSDFRPSAKKLWKPSIGILELGILKATGLAPMKMEARTDAYCVAKYGSKWVRTRTIVDSLSPKWNEPFIWEVYDPFTVLTILVFDNNQLNARGARDTIIGKIRIRLSTLERSKLYTHSYPLIGLQLSGVKKMGDIHLAVRFSWPFWSSFNVYQFYILPKLPKPHHTFPLSEVQLDTLRNQAAEIISLRFSKAEPPLGREVVYSMLDVRSDMWSMRKARANYYRIMDLLDGFITLRDWLRDIRYWKNPITTCLFYLQCILVLTYPEPALPMVCFYLFMVGLKRFFKRPRHPSHIDAKLSCADTASPEDLEEELDSFPSQLTGEPLRKRYDRMRGIAGSAEIIVRDLAIIGERLQALRTWRDARATSMFLIFCLVACVMAMLVPTKLIIFVWITFCLRHPRFRSVLPSIPENFFMRLPSKQAFIL